MNSDTLIIILSAGFIILIAFVCVALGTMIKIMLDIKKITDIARHEAEEIGEVMDAIGDKMKKYFTNSFIMDKIVPAILGAISVGASAKGFANSYNAKTKGKKTTTKGKKGKRYGNQDIFVEEEID